MINNNLINEIEIFAVPQGKNKSEWLDCYKYMLEHRYVKTIGMSKLSIPYAFLGGPENDTYIQESRWECIDLLIKMNLISKPLHFLGGEKGEEFIKYIQLNNKLFRSTDSCFTILAGIYYQDIKDINYKRKPTPKNYFNMTMNPLQINIAKNNIKYMDSIFNV